MRSFHILAAVLLVIAGINWGLYGLLGVNDGAPRLEAGTDGSLVWVSIEGAAVYQAAGPKAIQQRWNVEPSGAKA